MEEVKLVTLEVLAMVEEGATSTEMLKETLTMDNKPLVDNMLQNLSRKSTLVIGETLLKAILQGIKLKLLHGVMRLTLASVRLILFKMKVDGTSKRLLIPIQVGTLQVTTTKELMMREEVHLQDLTKAKEEAEAEVEVVKEEEEELLVHASSVMKKVTWLEIVLTLIRDKVEEAEVVLQEAVVITSASNAESLVISQENVPTHLKIKEIEAEEEVEEEDLDP